MTKEISAEARLLLIEVAEGIAEGVRRNEIRFSEGNARALAAWAERVLNPDIERREEGESWKNITEACDMIGITPQTFRKYVRRGDIKKGEKKRGYHEPLWRKEEIEKFKEWYNSQKRKA